MARQDDIPNQKRSSFRISWIIYLVLAIVLGYIVWLILSADGPLSRGLGDALGAAGNFVTGVVSGCTAQPDCAKLTDKEACPRPNCEWVTSQDSNIQPYCASTTGRPVGGGEFYSPKSILGIGFNA